MKALNNLPMLLAVGLAACAVPEQGVGSLKRLRRLSVSGGELGRRQEPGVFLPSCH